MSTRKLLSQMSDSLSLYNATATTLDVAVAACLESTLMLHMQRELSTPIWRTTRVLRNTLRDHNQIKISEQA